MKKIIICIVAGCSLIISTQAFSAQKDLCFECHEEAKFRNKVIHEPVGSEKCTICHNPHVARYEGLLSKEGGKLCFSCHTDEAVSFRKGIVHEPINLYQCTVCHSPHSSQEKGLVDKELKLACLRCHSQLAEKYKFTHDPYLNGECISCHKPHNSEQAMLLAVPKEDLCFECHDSAGLQDKHRGYPGTLRKCLTCHNPHGSERKGLIRNVIHEPYNGEGCSTCHEKGSGSVGVEKCIECHDDVIEQMESTHSHLAWKNGNACVNCHTPHAGDEKMLLIARQKQVCAQCHRPSIEWYKNSTFKHGGSIDNCTDCHYPHGGNDLAMLKGNGLEVCAICHENQGNFTHPVGPDVPDPRTGRMITCMTCHNPMGTEYPFNLILDGKEMLCVQCHNQY